jgi:hypothetical protein
MTGFARASSQSMPTSASELVHLLRARSGRGCTEVRVTEPVEQRLGDLTASRVPVADEEDADWNRAGLDGFERALEVDELDFEPLQLFALSRDRAPLLLERRGQYGVGRRAFEAPVGELPRLDRREPEAP